LTAAEEARIEKSGLREMSPLRAGFNSHPTPLSVNAELALLTSFWTCALR